jgi:glycerol-3-phosphate dehydrogenase
VLSTFAGLRPLLAGADDHDTSDLSRRHAIIESESGVLSIVGGKLTTYRRMAEDAVDAVIRRDPGFAPRPSPTRALPLVGAWPRHRLGEIVAASRLVRRFGAEAPYVTSLPTGPSAACGVTAQELEWGVRIEGALSVADLLDRRTRLGLVDTDRDESTDAATAAFARAGVNPIEV